MSFLARLSQLICAVDHRPVFLLRLARLSQLCCTMSFWLGCRSWVTDQCQKHLRCSAWLASSTVAGCPNSAVTAELCLSQASPARLSPLCVSQAQLGCHSIAMPGVPRIPPLGSRGPQRTEGSRVKMRCAFTGCRSGKDVKNVRQALKMKRRMADVRKCRNNLRSDCQALRFCCAAHRDRVCLPATPELVPYGRRAGLKCDQLVRLFGVLRESGAVWAAVLMLLQLACSERAGAATQIRAGWLKNLRPEAAGTPGIEIPHGINRKTVARTVPLTRTMAEMLDGWMRRAPLKGLGGHTDKQWPPSEEGQRITTARSLLFPGLVGFGPGRSKTKPVTPKGYNQRLKEDAIVWYVIKLCIARLPQLCYSTLFTVHH